MRDRNSETVDIFKIFIQTFSALIGGSVVVRLAHPNQIMPAFLYAADAIAVLIFAFAALIIVENVILWFSYRHDLTAAAGKDADGRDVYGKPGFWASVRDETWMLLVMFVALALYVGFNPLAFDVQPPPKAACQCLPAPAAAHRY